MADFLSQDEIDALLSIPGEETFEDDILTMLQRGKIIGNIPDLSLAVNLEEAIRLGRVIVDNKEQLEKDNNTKDKIKNDIFPSLVNDLLVNEKVTNSEAEMKYNGKISHEGILFIAKTSKLDLYIIFNKDILETANEKQSIFKLLDDYSNLVSSIVKTLITKIYIPYIEYKNIVTYNINSKLRTDLDITVNDKLLYGLKIDVKL